MGNKKGRGEPGSQPKEGAGIAEKLQAAADAKAAAPVDTAQAAAKPKADAAPQKAPDAKKAGPVVQQTRGRQAPDAQQRQPDRRDTRGRQDNRRGDDRDRRGPDRRAPQGRQNDRDRQPQQPQEGPVERAARLVKEARERRDREIFDAGKRYDDVIAAIDHLEALPDHEKELPEIKRERENLKRQFETTSRELTRVQSEYRAKDWTAELSALTAIEEADRDDAAKEKIDLLQQQLHNLDNRLRYFKMGPYAEVVPAPPAPDTRSVKKRPDELSTDELIAEETARREREAAKAQAELPGLREEIAKLEGLKPMQKTDAIRKRLEKLKDHEKELVAQLPPAEVAPEPEDNVPEDELIPVEDFIQQEQEKLDAEIADARRRLRDIESALYPLESVPAHRRTADMRTEVDNLRQARESVEAFIHEHSPEAEKPREIRPEMRPFFNNVDSVRRNIETLRELSDGYLAEKALIAEAQAEVKQAVDEFDEKAREFNLKVKEKFDALPTWQKKAINSLKPRRTDGQDNFAYRQAWFDAWKNNKALKPGWFRASFSNWDQNAIIELEALAKDPLAKELEELQTHIAEVRGRALTSLTEQKRYTAEIERHAKGMSNEFPDAPEGLNAEEREEYRTWLRDMEVDLSRTQLPDETGRIGLRNVTKLADRFASARDLEFGHVSREEHQARKEAERIPTTLKLSDDVDVEFRLHDQKKGYEEAMKNTRKEGKQTHEHKEAWINRFAIDFLTKHKYVSKKFFAHEVVPAMQKALDEQPDEAAIDEAWERLALSNREPRAAA